MQSKLDGHIWSIKIRLKSFIGLCWDKMTSYRNWFGGIVSASGGPEGAYDWDSKGIVFTTMKFDPMFVQVRVQVS